MKLFYSPEYVCGAYGFDTTRKAGWVVDSLTARPIRGIEMVAPEPLTVRDIEQVHDSDYVDAVRAGSPRELAESQGFDWDPGLWTMVLASNGGVLAAARVALEQGASGSLSSGLHHAKRERGEGFCTFNGLAIAAKALLAEGAVESVLILDLDAHCGGGTSQLIDEAPGIHQADVSVSHFDWYPETENSRLAMVTDADSYLPSIRAALDDAQNRGPYDLCLYNAGMDPYQGCPVGGLDGVTAEILAERERLVFEWCRSQGIPVAFVLAGGYIGSRLTESTLVNLHRLTVAEAAR